MAAGEALGVFEPETLGVVALAPLLATEAEAGGVEAV